MKVKELAAMLKDIDPELDVYIDSPVSTPDSLDHGYAKPFNSRCVIEELGGSAKYSDRIYRAMLYCRKVLVFRPL